MRVACTRCGFPGSAPEIQTPPTSPCPELLHSNTIVPDEYTSAEILKNIARVEETISLVDHRVAELKRALDELAVKRQELQNFVEDHRKVLAPIRILPVDILYAIFMQCVKRDWSSGWNPLGDPEWLLSKICRHWRTVALSIPQIWSKIYVASGTYLPNNPVALSPILLRQLERSAQAPLALSLPRNVSLSSEVRSYILGTFFSLAHRWQNVRLHLTSSDVQQAEVATISFPVLTTLSLSVDFSQFDYTFDHIFRSTPRLEELDYLGSFSRLPTLPRIHGLPLSQLKKITLRNHRLGMSEILTIFQLATEVVEFSFHSCRLRGLGSTSVHSHGTLWKLESLTIISADQNFLRHVDVPSLRQLHIIRPLSSTMGADIVSFLTRTSPPLTHLTLGLDRVLQLPKILRLVPHLSHLTLDQDTRVDVNLVKTLTCGPGKQNLVPHIVALSIEGTIRCDVQVLSDMLRSRCGFLRFVHLPHELRHVLDTLRADGLNVVSMMSA
ncbi:hypothetical protein C8R43DRAFT_550701 [Mycena crocata]|nr:hypothetical protein C8R43DRAFT_550701 [Mycena crocata]